MDKKQNDLIKVKEHIEDIIKIDEFQLDNTVKNIIQNTERVGELKELIDSLKKREEKINNKIKKSKIELEKINKKIIMEKEEC